MRSHTSLSTRAISACCSWVKLKSTEPCFGRFLSVELRRLLFVELLDEAGLVERGDERVIDELLRLCRLARRIYREVEQGLHARGGNVGRCFPNLDVGVVGFVQVFSIFRLGVFADDLFGRFRIGANTPRRKIEKTWTKPTTPTS